jgi:hypothetical protein
MPVDGLSSETAVMSDQHVNADTFVRAETDRMFAAVLADAGGVNQPGDHELTTDRYDTEDVAAVNALQDRIALSAAAARPFTFPDYDAASLDRTRSALLELAKGYRGFDRAFGPRQDVDPVRHLVGTAAGWGGLPSSEATYVNVDPGLPVGEYR